MAIQPFHSRITRKKGSGWKKLENMIALLSLVALIVSIVVGAIATNDANNRADEATAESSRLQEQLNSVLNSSLSEANNLTQLSLQLQSINSNFNTSVIPYIVEADLGRINYNVSNPSVIIDSDGFINLSLVVITPHAAILNFSKDEALNATFSRLNDTFWVNGIGIPKIDPEYQPLMWRFSFNDSWGLDFNPPVGHSYVAFVQPGVTQLNFSFPIHGTFWLNTEYVNSLDDKFVDLIHVCGFKVTMNLK